MDTALQMHPAAPPHLPIFITAPGQPDVLMTVMAVFMAIAVVSLGLVYLSLHALPEQMAHRTNKVQLQFVAVLALAGVGIAALGAYLPSRSAARCAALRGART